MDSYSPPKRMTRSRAAAKALETAAPKPSTAVSRANATQPSATRPASTKRKTPADEDITDEESDSLKASAVVTKVTRTRGRPKKAVEPADTAAPLSRPTRGRPKKAVDEPTKKTPTEEPAVRATRGRPKKVAQTSEDEGAPPEPLKKAIRTRGAMAATASTAAKATIKKSVKFEEPEKENVAPVTKAKAPSQPATGMRGRPVRKTTTSSTTSRATKAAGPTISAEKTPLSPRKVTQMSVSRDYASEDELATMEKTPLRKSPIKLPPSALTGLNLEKTAPAHEVQDHVEDRPTSAMTQSVLASPAKRPPAPPFKDIMRSPAKRADGIQLSRPVSQVDDQQGATSLKSSLLKSPAKRPQSPIKGLSTQSLSKQQETLSSFKTSLLQSPAKRPVGIVKGFPSVKREMMPQGSPVGDDSASSPTPMEPRRTRPSEMLLADGDVELAEDDESKEPEPIRSLEFSGRLSAILPRHADPAMNGSLEAGTTTVEHVEPTETRENGAADLLAQDLNEAETAETLQAVTAAEEMREEDIEANQSDVDDISSPNTTTPPHSPPKNHAMFGLRRKDLDPYHDLDSESEDELVSSIQQNPFSKRRSMGVPETPTPVFGSKTPRTQTNVAKRSIMPPVGFTPLAQQFGAWSASSPAKTAGSASLNMSLFDDEMSVRDNAALQEEIEAAVEADAEGKMDDPIFDDVMVTEEDVELAAEAEEMSLLDQDQLQDMGALVDLDDSVSEASQEYGDENQMPIDPALAGESSTGQTMQIPPVTPARVVTKTFHTVSKVPLKPADESTPPPRRRCHSISRLPVSTDRRASMSWSSPSKREEVPSTPSKSDLWSTLGTPPRTPRQDVDPGLLRGAVVYVDVYTSEGADASSIFVELLGQMGARCMKSWTWNPTSPNGNDASKIGITHVVYKDGGKRTLEKVRQANGVVQCVGVSWVLDCERENRWIEEGPYLVDTSLVPRGGARRRKSMEPKALANLNGTLISSPVKTHRDSQTAPNTPCNTGKGRRDTVVWMRTPPELQGYFDNNGGDDEDMESEWGDSLLIPVPATPAPEEIARYAAQITPEDSTTVVGANGFGQDELLMRTCPPKARNTTEYGPAERIDGEQHLMMKIMAARRKSLQFAPKIGSPLSRTWS